MAIITIKRDGRGRPLKIDTERELAKFMAQLPRAKARLQELRRSSSGERNEAILGSETMLPKAIEITADVLQALDTGIKIDIDTAKELKANLKTVQQLASKQERVYGKALADALFSQYERDITYQSKYASKFASKRYSNMLEAVRGLSKAQQQKFFLSRHYQNVKTNRGDYRRVVEWAENDILERTGEEVTLTGEEALAYVEEAKLETAIKEFTGE